MTKSGRASAHLTSGDVMQLEHEYGAHKYVYFYFCRRSCCDCEGYFSRLLFDITQLYLDCDSAGPYEIVEAPV